MSEIRPSTRSVRCLKNNQRLARRPFLSRRHSFLSRRHIRERGSRNEEQARLPCGSSKRSSCRLCPPLRRAGLAGRVRGSEEPTRERHDDNDHHHHHHAGSLPHHTWRRRLPQQRRTNHVNLPLRQRTRPHPRIHPTHLSSPTHHQVVHPLPLETQDVQTLVRFRDSRRHPYRCRDGIMGPLVLVWRSRSRSTWWINGTKRSRHRNR